MMFEFARELVGGVNLSEAPELSVMDPDDEYRKQAAYAQEMADRQIGLLDKVAWLRVAQGWVGLIRKAKSTPTEELEQQAKAEGTGQDDSTDSH